MGFLAQIKWALAYKKKHPETTRAELDAAIKSERMKETYKKPHLELKT